MVGGGRKEREMQKLATASLSLSLYFFLGFFSPSISGSPPRSISVRLCRSQSHGLSRLSISVSSSFTCNRASSSLGLNLRVVADGSGGRVQMVVVMVGG